MKILQRHIPHQKEIDKLLQTIQTKVLQQFILPIKCNMFGKGFFLLFEIQRHILVFSKSSITYNGKCTEKGKSRCKHSCSH